MKSSFVLWKQRKQISVKHKNVCLYSRVFLWSKYLRGDTHLHKLTAEHKHKTISRKYSHWPLHSRNVNIKVGTKIQLLKGKQY